MPANLTNLEVWLHGLIAAFVGGGASAVTTGIVAPAIAPQAFNFHEQFSPLLQLMGALFVVNGLMAAFAYLAKSPVPQLEIVTQVEKTDIQPSGDGVKTTKVTQTTTEPKT